MPITTAPLSRSAEGILFTGCNLNYRITGLTAYNLDRMRITLKASVIDKPAEFHIDTLDLYQSRARECFASDCEKHLKIQAALVAAELTQLINALENERINMREKGSAQIAVPAMTDAEKDEALKLLKSKDLMQQIAADFEALGYIGEQHNKLIGVLASISRLLPEPLALLFLSRPGAGKTGLQNTICKLTPPESVIQYTRLTGQSLFYRESNALKNKVLSIEEEEGMQDAMYSIKTLISSQKLSVAATRTDAKTGKFSVDEYTVHGPVVVMVSTTNPDALDDETKQRFLILTIDESQEQTEKILQAQRTKNTESWYKFTSDESTVAKLHHTIQRLLKPLIVTFPADLKILWPYGKLQMRREHQKFLSLVKAITLLHQYQRKTGSLQRADGSRMDFVQTTHADVELALALGKDIFARNADDVSPTGRTLLKDIISLVRDKQITLQAFESGQGLQLAEIPFTRKELRERIGWSETQTRRNCEHLAELGYLGRIGGRQGTSCRYILVDTGEDDPVLAFRMNELERNGWKEHDKSRKSGTYT